MGSCGLLDKHTVTCDVGSIAMCDAACGSWCVMTGMLHWAKGSCELWLKMISQGIGYPGSYLAVRAALVAVNLCCVVMEWRQG